MGAQLRSIATTRPHEPSRRPGAGSRGRVTKWGRVRDWIGVNAFERRRPEVTGGLAYDSRVRRRSSGPTGDRVLGPHHRNEPSDPSPRERRRGEPERRRRRGADAIDWLPPVRPRRLRDGAPAGWSEAPAHEALPVSSETTGILVRPDRRSDRRLRGRADEQLQAWPLFVATCARDRLMTAATPERRSDTLDRARRALQEPEMEHPTPPRG